MREASKHGRGLRLPFSLRVAIALVVLLPACRSPPTEEDPDGGASDAAAPVSDGRTLPCAVEVAVQSHCRVCHSSPPREGVPFPLVTYADTQRTTTLTTDGLPAPIWRVMGDVIAQDRMPVSTTTFVPDPLPADSPARQAILDWVDAGAPPRAEDASCP